MRTFIWFSFLITFVAVTIYSAPAAIDPNMILYFAFDEQLDGRKVEDLTGGGNDGKLKLGAKITNDPAEVYKGAGALKILTTSVLKFSSSLLRNWTVIKTIPTPFSSISLASEMIRAVQ